ncbi:condensation domain-containing protein [Saccharothrix saharensis]|uniref:Condensation domain-containing protein n=1 Tax=Saccharothrix saharensis TaxID=571190 RepID=A0A543JR66_9PSEU|nr:condensation domain-containing protein [Saccharothrix saharensis]TQM85330.1 condensation domain-containing protein [Saccharothrix saharensis]
MSTSTDTGRRRRRVRLTPVDAIQVTATGSRAAEGPVTLGQLNTMQWLGPDDDHIAAVLRVELPVPDGRSVADVVETAAVLVARHESLRTTYVRGEDPRQVVSATGAFTLHVCALGEGPWGPRDRTAVAVRLLAWLQERRDTAATTLRMAVATDEHGTVIACVAGFSHMAVDFGSIEVLKREFAGMLAHPDRRQVGEPRHQPLDQAELEATPAERRRTRAANDYVRDLARRQPRYVLALPGTSPSGESLAVELSSPAAAMAVRQVAARTRSSRSSVVLAATCAVLARRTGYRELVFPSLSSNRFERHLVDFVGSLAQGNLVAVEVGDRGFDALVKHTWAAVLEASRHSRYDGVERGAADARTQHERGMHFLYDPLFNSLVPESWSGVTAGVKHRPEEITAALRQTELRGRPVPHNGTPLRFGLTEVDGRVRLDLWSSDTGLVPRAEMESLLLAVERLLVAAAAGDLDAQGIREATGVETITRTSDWVLVDSCWVDLVELQRLLDEALAPATARAFGSVDGRDLVAYLTATDAVRTPEQAHARCLAALPGYLNVLTPRHYVLCPTAPTDPTDPAAWPAPLATGTGR